MSATCTEDGEEVYECARCDAKNVVRLPALGHQFQEATCFQPKTCLRCKATSGAPLGHLVKFGICGRCGNEVENAPRSAEIAAENARHEEALSEINAEYAEIDSTEASAKAVFTRYSESYPPKYTSIEYYGFYADARLRLMNLQSEYQYLSPNDPYYQTKKVQLESDMEYYAMLKARYDPCPTPQVSMSGRKRGDLPMMKNWPKRMPFTNPISPPSTINTAERQIPSG